MTPEQEALEREMRPRDRAHLTMLRKMKHDADTIAALGQALTDQGHQGGAVPR